MRWLAPLAIVLVAIDIPLTLLVAPEAANFRAPLTQRIFYYHVPAAWVAYLAFAVTAVASALQLGRGAPGPGAGAGARRWDALAAASAEVGTVFSLIALATGLVWAGQEFIGYSPFQDAKVITLLVVILSYAAYFALRAGIAEADKRARLCAVYGLLAFLGVPLSYLASRASLHPDFTRADESLDASLGLYLLASTVAFTVLYAALVELRLRYARLEAHDAH
jgi:heme exporter protein C